MRGAPALPSLLPVAPCKRPVIEGVADFTGKTSALVVFQKHLVCLAGEAVLWAAELTIRGPLCWWPVQLNTPKPRAEHGWSGEIIRETAALFMCSEIHVAMLTCTGLPKIW